jgi:RadC-like JAB domain
MPDPTMKRRRPLAVRRIGAPKLILPAAQSSKAVRGRVAQRQASPDRGPRRFDRVTHGINRAPQGNIQVPVVDNAEAIFTAHNHPSGSPEPSPEDIDITERLRECGELLGIRLIDHVIISGENHLSFVASGYWQHRRTKTAK